MTTSVQDLLAPKHKTSAWSEVECRTRFCQRCEKIPFDEGKFHGCNGIITVSDTGGEILQLSSDDLHDHDGIGHCSLEVDFELVDNWPQLPAIAKSAEKCDFCRLLETRLRKTELPPEFQHAWIHVKLFYCWWDQKVSLWDQFESGLAGLKALVCGKLKQEDEFTDLVWLTFTIDADEGECKRWLQLQQRPPAEFLSGVNISKITARLESLGNNRTSNFLPTRLIDLGCHDKPSGSGRLVTKEEAFDEHCTSPMYVALSYPWGSPEQAARQAKTTRENIHERATTINLQAVSQVIQDAVTVCKLLGVRYLWVDALCIIQGDLQDWERESTTMGNIFRNAYLTIAAAAIQSCHESFLTQNVDILEIPFASRTEPRIKGTYRLVSRNNKDAKVSCLLHSDDETDASGPWKDRGWVFQEVAMSTRLLVFGKTTMTLKTLEEGRKVPPTWYSMVNLSINHFSWRELVQEYSGLNLTFQKDTFPAISGLARLFAEHLKDEYLAGIWRNHIFISLFWYTPPPYLKRQSLCALINKIPSRPYVAPSWSWAAEKKYTEFGTSGIHPWQSEYQATSECNVIDAECTVEGLDPFGVVQNGYIVLSAKVLRLEIGKFSFILTPGWSQGYHDFYLIDSTRVMEVFLDGDPERRDPDIHRVVFLLLGSCKDRDMESRWKVSDGRAPNGERCAYGLVLYPAQGAKTFYRVGIFNSQAVKHAPDGGLKFCDNWRTEEITIV